MHLKCFTAAGVWYKGTKYSQLAWPAGRHHDPGYFCCTVRHFYPLAQPLLEIYGNLTEVYLISSRKLTLKKVNQSVLKYVGHCNTQHEICYHYIAKIQVLRYSPLKWLKKQTLAKIGAISESTVVKWLEYFSVRSPLLNSLAKASLNSTRKMLWKVTFDDEKTHISNFIHTSMKIPYPLHGMPTR